VLGLNPLVGARDYSNCESYCLPIKKGKLAETESLQEFSSFVRSKQKHLVWYFSFKASTISTTAANWFWNYKMIENK